jgi:hypothetical protein
MSGERENGGPSSALGSLEYEAKHPLGLNGNKKEQESEALRSVRFEKQHPSRFDKKEHPDVQALRFEVERQKRQEPTREEAEALLKKAGLLNNRNGLENLYRATK